jgi:triosephosphate isomerase
VKTLIVANWKMNPQTLKQARQIFDAVKKDLSKVKNNKSEIAICPPFPYLSAINDKKINLGAQNCFWEQKGAFTGETSCAILKDLGCKYVLVGHSERRKYFNETNENINKKIKAILDAKMIPILCIGETLAERKQGIVQKVLQKQITSALKNISKFKVQSSKFIIAYEPIWAIGTGKSCDIDTALNVNLLIKKIINAPLLYGGSVNSDNARSYIQDAKMDGLLIGGASLKPKEFIKIIKSVGI